MDFEALRTISDETEQIRQTYTLFREETRLFASQAAQVEFLTTVHYIERYLPAGGRLLDIGAGAGAYSLYFARKGYTVEALELSPANVEAFRRQLRAEEPVILVHRHQVIDKAVGEPLPCPEGAPGSVTLFTDCLM